MANVLTAAEAAAVLRCSATDTLMLAMLPGIDQYLRTATGHDWASDSTIHAGAKNAARILLVMWYENPGQVGQGVTSLDHGLAATLGQLEALVERYVVFEGASSAGYVALPQASEGDAVSEVVGVSGVSGDQSASFESTISETGYIEQLADSLEDKFFRVLLTPPGE